MHKYRKEALEKSEQFVSRSKSVLNAFNSNSSQQQAEINSLFESGIVQAKANATQQRAAELTLAFHQLRQGTQQLIHSLVITDVPTLANIANESQSQAIADNTNVSEVLTLTNSSGSRRHKVTEEQMFAEEVAKDPVVVDLQSKIAVLNKRKQALEQMDSSLEAYQTWATNKKEYLIAAGVWEEVMISDSKISAYEEWKEGIVELQQKQLASINTELLSNKKLLSQEKTRALAACKSYDLAYARKMNYLQSMSLDDDEIANNMNLTFPSRANYNRNLAAKYAQNTDHPFASSLAAVLLNDQAKVDPGWNDMSNFYSNPIPIETFNLLPDISAARVKEVQDASGTNVNVALKILTKGGKIISGSLPGGYRFLGAAIFELADTAVSELNPDAKRVAQYEDKLDQTLKCARAVIPRVAGKNEDTLKSMYNDLNSVFEALAADTKTPRSIKLLIDKEIRNNYTSEARQLEELRTYCNRPKP